MRGRSQSSKGLKRDARRRRVRRKIQRSGRPLLTVYRSARHMYAQLVEAETGRTIVSVSTRSKSVVGGLSGTGNAAAASQVGKAIAEVARERKIPAVVFNRNGFLYHGRVKALADAAREAGLRF